jgi:hypothetical protein
LSFSFFWLSRLILQEIGWRSPQGFALRDDNMDSRQQSSGMTAGGELRLLALGHTWEFNYYITELAVSEQENICEILG